ncbi:MAG: hypothetical protein LBP73_04040 [Clostridiales Family XIII bacterium]|jgi:hypothetical protein|nr:hypothetical protein [Clostridiales Family XIII bacterium]
MANDAILCLNGEIKPGDSVISVGGGAYRYLIGEVRSIDGSETTEHTTGIRVDFTVFDYYDDRIGEIEAAFEKLRGYAAAFEDLPLDDAIVAPGTLIRFGPNDISREELDMILESEESAAAFCDGEFARRMGIEIPDSAPERKGYVVAESDGDGYIPGALHIERNDSLFMYPNDSEAARAAEADGVKLIYGLPYIPDGMYLDTPENRALIGRVSEETRLAMPATGELLRKLHARLDECYGRWENVTRMRDKKFLFDDAESIAATRLSYGYFRNEYEFTVGRAEFLLKFENPLDLLSDRWADSALLVARRTAKAVFGDRNRTPEHGDCRPASEAARQPLIQTREDGLTSVLDTLRRARENPPEHAPNPDRPERNKPDHDL